LKTGINLANFNLVRNIPFVPKQFNNNDSGKAAGKGREGGQKILGGAKFLSFPN